MNKEEQIEFIKDNYPATTHHISKREFVIIFSLV